MFKHYLIVARRTLMRSKVFSLINVCGLSIGLTCSILILLFIKDEVSFDKFHEKKQNIYRVITAQMVDGDTKLSSITGPLEGPAFTQHVPGIKAYLRYLQDDTEQKKGADIRPFSLFRTDSNFFSVFSFPLISGDAESCLIDPYSIILSKDEAIRQFGSINVIGKTLLLKEDSSFKPFTVTAVAKNCPQNSSIRFDALAPMHIPLAEANNKENWFNSYLNTFVLLGEKADPAQTTKQMQVFFEKDAAPSLQFLLHKYGLPDEDISLTKYQLQPLSQMHMDNSIESGNGISPTSNFLYSYILSAIALFILLTACINFINLTIARSIKRAKEIGIRKVLGSNRNQLFGQFMGESVLLCIIAFILAILLTIALLPIFNSLANKSLALSYLMDTKLVLELAGLFILTIFVAGFYPALVLTRFNPTKTLYNQFQKTGKNYLQRGLIIAQFALASILIVLTFVIYQQFNFLIRADLGYNDINLIAVYHQSTGQQSNWFKKQLELDPNIRSVSAKNAGNHYSICKVNHNKVIKYRNDKITDNFLSVLQIPLEQGRNFSSKLATDSIDKVLVNQAFVKQAGWTRPIGQTITYNTDGDKQVQVIGVVKNYHYGSLNDPINPQILHWTSINQLSTFYIKINREQRSRTLNYIKKIYRQAFPLSPFSFTYLREQNKQQYSAIAKWQQILLFGGLITIIISFMGLFGLSVLASQRRKKEIGIRKVYGASIRNIVQLLTTDYLKLVILALLIATPLSWVAAKKFLQTMLYRISLTPELFLIPDIIIVVMAFLTVYFQTRRSASTNPAKSLQSE